MEVVRDLGYLTVIFNKDSIGKGEDKVKSNAKKSSMHCESFAFRKNPSEELIKNLYGKAIFSSSAWMSN